MRLEFKQKNLLFFILLLFFGGIIVGIDYYLFLKNPLEPTEGLKKININKGDKIFDIAKLLKTENVIDRVPYFVSLSLYYKKRLSKQIKSGEYYLSGAMAPLKIMEIITEGKVIRYTVTIPEGYEIDKIAGLLFRMELINRDKFLSLTQDKEFISKLGLEVNDLEGFLFPSTYFFSKGMKEESIIKEMVDNFQKIITPEIKKRLNEIGFSLQEVITLASMIEKETSVEEERALVSAVFHNRLKKKNLLQCDPTIIYALKDNYQGRLFKNDLALDSPYNTYKYLGLPPGPIGNPGYLSIRAALYPEPNTDYFFFVLMDNGRHFFSNNYSAHNTAVKKYRLGIDE